MSSVVRQLSNAVIVISLLATVAGFLFAGPVWVFPAGIAMGLWLAAFWVWLNDPETSIFPMPC